MGLKLNAATGIIAGFVLLVGAGGAWLLHSAEPEARALPPKAPKPASPSPSRARPQPRPRPRPQFRAPPPRATNAS